MRLRNRVAVLAGVGRGMGRSTARLFAQEGARIAVVARDIQKGKETAELIQEDGGEVMHFTGDLTNRPFVESMIAEVIAQWGRLDILYYGAGGFFDPSMSLDRMENHDEPFFELAITNTLNGLYNLVQACRRHLHGSGCDRHRGSEHQRAARSKPCL